MRPGKPPTTNGINFRDCGGYPTNDGGRVKRGMLYRSASPDRAFGKNRRLLLDAGLKTMIDFRPDSERSKLITSIPGVRRISIPLMVDALTRERILPHFNRRNGTADLTVAVESVYRDIVPLVAGPVRRIFTVLADEAVYPLCMNCRAGKDRTGYAVAVILRTLGVPDRFIYDDYLISNRFLLPRVRLITRPLLILSLGMLPARTWEASVTANERYLTATFGVIDSRYGGIEGYLDFCGVPPTMRDRVRMLLRE